MKRTGIFLAVFIYGKEASVLSLLHTQRLKGPMMVCLDMNSPDSVNQLSSKVLCLFITDKETGGLVW